MATSYRRGGRPAASRSTRGRRSGERLRDTFAIQRDQRMLELTGFALMILLTFIGGGIAGDLQIAALGIVTVVTIGVLAFDGGFAAVARLPFAARLFVAGIVALPMLQLVPLPPALWQALPGQELRVAVLGYAGAASSWQPLSLVPVSTAQSAIQAIIFVVLLVALLAMTDAGRVRAAWLVLALTLLGTAIGVLQVATGGQPRVHASSHEGALLGFFANKNHMGLALAASLPLAAWLLRVGEGRRGRLWFPFIGYWILVLVALVATNSRAGLLLGLLASVAIGWRMMRGRRARYRFALAAGAAAVIGFVATSSIFDALFNRFNSVSDDLRLQFWQHTTPLIATYRLSGSGIGSFERLFVVNEQLGWVKPTYVNHAHNEYLEIALETGVAGYLLLLLGVAVMAVAWFRLRNEGEGGRAEAGWAAGLVVAMIALHSGIDYPLRRMATFPLAATACALLLAAWLPRRSAGEGTDPQ